MTSAKQKRQDEIGDGSWVFRGRFYRVLGSKVHALGKKKILLSQRYGPMVRMKVLAIFPDGADDRHLV